MNIKKYASYFHDGSIFNIDQIKDIIEISMQSAEILPDENRDHIILSEINTIRGKLHFDKVKNIKIDEQFVKKIEKTFDIGEILDFEIVGNKIILLVIWENYPPKPRERVTELIEVEAENYYWKNIPDLVNPFW